MAVNKVDYRATRIEDTNRGHSPQIWGDCPIQELIEDPSRGFYYREDFTLVSQYVTPTITSEAGYSSGYKAFGSSGATILSAGIENGGGLALVTAGTDNHSVNLQMLALPFKINRSNGPLWYEARVKINSIADTVSGFFVGLLESVTLTAIVPITAAGAIADKNIVGFHRLEGDGDQLDTIYKADGVTQVTVKGDALGDLPTTTALAANTFIKVGMKYEPTGNKGAYQLKFFVNGYELPDRVTVASAAGTDFPNDVQLAPVFALTNATGSAATLTVDWLECAQAAV